MGCWASKPAFQEVADVDAKPGADSAFAHDSGKQLSLSPPSSGGPSDVAKSTPQRPPSRGSSAPAELRPEQLITWKLHPEEAASQSTFKSLELIKDAACMDLSLKRSKIGLFDFTRLWFKTNVGAFSPAMPFADTGMGEQYNAFQASDDKTSTVLVIPDLTKVPRLKDNPAVKERPHVTYSATSLIISRTAAGRGHPLGVVIIWDSKPGPVLTQQQEQRLAEAGEAACAALQRELFTSLGLDPTEASKITTSPELPTVWIDLNDTNWRVLGINSAWKTLTGVGLDVLEGFPGLLTPLVPSDGADTAMAGAAAAAAAADLPPGASLPLILSPCAPAAGTLQFAVALRRPDGPPPLPASNLDSHVDADHWIIECHACLQADDHRGEFSSGDLMSSLFTDSQQGSAASDSGSTPVASATPPTGSSRRAPTPATLAAPSIPPRLASLQLGHLLGSGSYANVYAGRLGNRPVAVKIMAHAYGPESLKDDWLSHYEAIATVGISHDNVIATLDWTRLEDVGGWSVWIVQELAVKGSLSAAITRGVLREGGVPEAPADMRAILSTAREIARGMRFLHSMDEIHGDLSSNNVMLSTADNARGFVAKVSDFGLSRIEVGGSALTQTVGTVTHMAPELLVEGKTSTASDVFSFGVVLYEMWRGERAWAGMGQHQVIFAVACRGERIEMPPDAPEDYAKLANECMAPDRKDRPSFNEIVPRIDALLTALGPPPPLARPSSRGLRPRQSED